MNELMPAWAAVWVDDQHRDAYNHLKFDHRLQEKAQLQWHKARLNSFEDRRIDAEMRHAKALNRIQDQRELEEGMLLSKQRSARGRIAEFLKPGTNQKQRDALERKFDKARSEESIKFMVTTEKREIENQKARLSAARDIKQFREERRDHRQKFQALHQKNRDAKIQSRTHDMKAAAELQLRRELRELSQKNTQHQQPERLSQTFARHR